MMAVYRTKGAVKRRIKTLARIAGLSEPSIVCFSRREIMAKCPQALKGHRKTLCSNSDTARARAWKNFSLIWISLPANDDTLAHEVNHLRAHTSHNSRAFQTQTVALSRGLDPRKAKPKWYQVTVITKHVRNVFELTPQAAKQRWMRGSELQPSETEITARQIKKKA